MAYAAAVEFMIEKLKQLLMHHAHLLSGADHELEKLDNHLLRFKAFIGDAPEQYSSGCERLIRRIRDAVYDAEEAYVIRKSSVKDPDPDPPNIVRTVEEIVGFLQEIRCIYGENSSSRADPDNSGDEDGDPALENKKGPISKRMNVEVRLKDEVERLTMHLMEESAELQVLSIIGMAGLGKTTLAQSVFYDQRIVHEFPIRIWVHVSQDFTAKETFLRILNKFTLLSDDIQRKNDTELAKLVVGILGNEKFLLVMDDVRSPEDWDRLKVALPTSNKMGRVMVISRVRDVGRHVDPSRDPYTMRFLTQLESFQLLYTEAFASIGQELSPELRALGEDIAGECRGHPFAIKLVGGVIYRAFVNDARTMITVGRKVYERLSCIIDDDPMELVAKVIALSYEDLPYQLRECLLYFGMFPKYFKISIWKLIRLWIAEGFIQHKLDTSLEETARYYLSELMTRNLAKGVRWALSYKAKTARVHDLIYDFCITQAAMDGFFQQVKMSDDGGRRPPVDEELKFRRLCIHSNALNFVSKRPDSPTVSSFICSSREEMDMPMKDLSSIPKGFKVLRVLDVEPINFNLKLPRDVFQLLRLKYLFLSIEFDVLPWAFSRLVNIQTLVLKTSTRTLEVRADILNLAQLRHFKTKASAALPETSTSSVTAGENFQTLGKISPESCTKDFFDRARNLKKLGVRGNLASLLDEEKGSFDSLGKLKNLENLKLLNDVYPIPPSGLPVLSLPPPHKFPTKLKILTLSRTYLDWCQMPTLGSLENLKVLTLDDKAFVGDTWELCDGGFLRLEILRIDRTNLKNWLASDTPFPKLEVLQLGHCDDLEQIPIELADVPSFLDLDVFHCKRAAASARKIEAKIKLVKRVFNLFISPLK